MVAAAKPVRVGCSGWAYKEWRGAFYPEKLAQRRWLEYYASQFDTVEVNSTFYRLPGEATIGSWLEETPDGFRFAVKASRYITHIKKLTSPEKYVERFLGAIGPIAAADKLEAVLWQLPPSLRRNDERLAAALDAIQERSAARHVVEFRNETWFTDDVYALLRERGVALAIADDPEFPFQQPELTADWTYIRFHRGGRGTGGKYSAADFAAWSERIANWRREADVVAYFNNDPDSFAVDNARTLREALA